MAQVPAKCKKWFYNKSSCYMCYLCYAIQFSSFLTRYHWWNQEQCCVGHGDKVRLISIQNLSDWKIKRYDSEALISDFKRCSQCLEKHKIAFDISNIILPHAKIDIKMHFYFWKYKGICKNTYQRCQASPFDLLCRQIHGMKHLYHCLSLPCFLFVCFKIHETDKI